MYETIHKYYYYWTSVSNFVLFTVEMYPLKFVKFTNLMHIILYKFQHLAFTQRTHLNNVDAFVRIKRYNFIQMIHLFFTLQN